MQLGVGSYTFAWAIGVLGREPARPMNALSLLEKAAALGVRVVQIADNLPLDRLPLIERDQLIERADELGIAIEVGTRGIGTEHLRTYLRLAQCLGSRILRVVTDTHEHRPSPEETVRLLARVVSEFGRARVVLAIENHDRFAAGALARIVERLGSDHVGICLDTVNSFGALEGPQVVLDTLAPHVVNLHIKDFTIRRVGHQMGFAIEGTPAGQGQLDVPWLLSRLRAAGRDPNAILELWTPPEPTIEATIAKEDAWACESIRYLRALIPE